MEKRAVALLGKMDVGIVPRLPGGTIRELIADRDVPEAVVLDDGRLQIPLDVQGEEVWRAYVVEW